FLFYSPRAHLALPSFPTRRSSDLTGRDLGGDGVHQRGVAANFRVAARLAAADHTGGEPALRVGPDRDVGQAEVSECGRCVATERSEEHTSELQSRGHLVCRLLLEK